MDKTKRLGTIARENAVFDAYLKLWNLLPDGEPIATQSSDLLPVLYRGSTRAMLKIARSAEERFGNALMVWWEGEGAARVLAQQEDALLLERAMGNKSLTTTAQAGGDASATRIICGVAAKLHAERPEPVPELVPLKRWFEELTPAAGRVGGVLRESLEASRELLDDPRDVVVLHGDLHHGNVLDGGDRGWLAIDPKALIGERAFDFANIFCNPDLRTATAPGRLAKQTMIVADAAHIDRARLLKWILAYAGLSAAWSLGSNDGDPACALSIAEIAALELNN
jgi:streptomycin 6-kinase